ncbi:topoisomerase TRF4 [Histoplasma capsulatum var. duboisii H88]|uniref:Topoisomerase TRF4 n=1 Tax=Ajellomyces capsulatus (strain H88) TaxID=544711 RepID=A0A8A1L7Z1_AJEC8|nr:topoisomerase TRF4 [Histoplasma capsulatum var. duboisii H88]
MKRRWRFPLQMKRPNHREKSKLSSLTPGSLQTPPNGRTQTHTPFYLHQMRTQ